MFLFFPVPSMGMEKNQKTHTEFWILHPCALSSSAPGNGQGFCIKRYKNLLYVYHDIVVLKTQLCLLTSGIECIMQSDSSEWNGTDLAFPSKIRHTDSF